MDRVDDAIDDGNIVIDIGRSTLGPSPSLDDAVTYIELIIPTMELSPPSSVRVADGVDTVWRPGTVT